MTECESCTCENEEEEEEDLSKELAQVFKFLEPTEENVDEGDDLDGLNGTHRPHFKLRDYEKQEKKEESPRLLDPNHPLLEKFQKSLKDHLVRQIEHLSNEIFELETGAKKKNQAREQVGVEAYEMQQNVCKQQIEIEKCIEELQSTMHARLQVENQLVESEVLHKEEAINLLEAEKKEMELGSEIKSMDLLLYKMTSWMQEMESDLLVNQRISEKTRRDKIKLADEKRELDIIIYKLMTEVWRLEDELEGIEMQLRVKEKDRERLAEAVVHSNTDIEALESEHRCLLHSWHSVIVAIGNRDKHYNGVQKDYQDYVQKVQSVISEIAQVKKLCKTEMIRNEQLSIFKTRILTDIELCEHLLEVELRKKAIVERDMHQISTITERIDKDIQKLNGEISHRDRELNVLLREFDQLCSEKIKLEEKILIELEDQITNDKAAAYLRRMVSKAKQKNLDMELAMAATENQNAKVLDMAEAQKEINTQLNTKVQDVESEIKALEAEIKAANDEVKKCTASIYKREQDFDLLNKKLEIIVQRNAGSTLSPQEIKIKTLEKNIVELIENNKLQQKFWLRLQGHICQLSEQRQEQIKEISLLKKQTTILKQRNLKITDDLDSYIKKEQQINRSVSNLYNKVSILNEQFHIKKGSMNNLTENNSLLKDDFISRLEDLELETLKIQDALEEFQNEKVRLSDDLIEKNRERLAWEKKLKMVLETKENLKSEKEGEVGNMRAEIHRMHVRYGQLKKVQEKLITDMEYSVLRRDAIYTVAEAREKKHQEGSTFTRVNFLRKLDDMKNKFKQLEGESDTFVKRLGSVKEQEATLEDEFKNIQQQIDDMKKVQLETEIGIEKAKTDKQLNLEILVIKQKKLKTFSTLVQGKKPPLLFRTETIIIAEYEKQRQINQKLLMIIEQLMSIFPNQHEQLNRIFNTLQLPSLCT